MFPSLCGLPHPVSDHPHSVFKTQKKFKCVCIYIYIGKKKKIYIGNIWAVYLLYFIWCSVILVLSLGTTEKSPAPPSLLLQSRIYIHWWDVHVHTLKSPSDLKVKRHQLFQLLLVQHMFRWDVFYNHCFVFSRLKLWVLDSSQYGLKTQGNS